MELTDDCRAPHFLWFSFQPEWGEAWKGVGSPPSWGGRCGEGSPQGRGGHGVPPQAFPSPTRTLAAGSGGFSREPAPALLSGLTGVCSQGGALPPALQL